VIRGIDEIDPDVDGAVQDGDGLPLVAVAQLALKRRAAVADGGDFQAFLAEITVIHERAPFSDRWIN
jgi:hypothetical protein